MRVAYVCADPGVPVFGCKGASVHVQEVLRALQRRGATVELFATRLGGEAPADLRHGVLHPLPLTGAATGAEARARAALAANAALHDALHKAVQQRGRFDIVYERYSLWSHAGMAFARANDAAGLLEVNAPLIEEQARHRTLPLPEQAERVARQVFADARALLAVSPGVADYLAGFDPARQRILVIDNGVDPARFASAACARRPWSPASGRPFRIGFLGTLKPWHGVDGLIDAFAQLVGMPAPGVAKGPAGGAALDAELQIIGDGPQREALALHAAERGVAARVRLVGALPPAEVPAALAALDVGVAPYPSSQGFYFSPLKLFEYLAAGLPVLTTDVGHLRSLVGDGIDALVVPPDDPAALARALHRLALDPALAARLGSAARQRALQHCSWDAVAGRILALASAPAAVRPGADESAARRAA
jgi:glycosyltransferase involved in cell wall biosynthesis